jgi:hypothetical protein
MANEIDLGPRKVRPPSQGHSKRFVHSFGGVWRAKYWLHHRACRTIWQKEGETRAADPAARRHNAKALQRRGVAIH